MTKLKTNQIESINGSDNLEMENKVQLKAGSINDGSTVSSFKTIGSEIETLGSTGNQSTLEVYQPTGNDDAFMTFHIHGDWATYFGLDGTTHNLVRGGWSDGNNSYMIYDEKNAPNSVVQVKTVRFGPARQTITSASMVAVTGSNISFTPKYSDSKIIIMCQWSDSSTYVSSYSIFKNGSSTVSTSGYTNNNVGNTHSTTYHGSSATSNMYNHSLHHVEDASNTSARTYQLYAASTWSSTNYTLYMNNRGSNDMASFGHMTVMEIKQ